MNEVLQENTIFSNEEEKKAFESDLDKVKTMFWLNNLGMLSLKTASPDNAMVIKYFRDSGQVRLRAITDNSNDMLVTLKTAFDKGYLRLSFVNEYTKLLYLLKSRPKIELNEDALRELFGKINWSMIMPDPKIRPFVKSWLDGESTLNQIIKPLFRYARLNKVSPNFIKLAILSGVYNSSFDDVETEDVTHKYQQFVSTTYTNGMVSRAGETEVVKFTLPVFVPETPKEVTVTNKLAARDYSDSEYKTLSSKLAEIYNNANLRKYPAYKDSSNNYRHALVYCYSICPNVDNFLVDIFGSKTKGLNFIENLFRYVGDKNWFKEREVSNYITGDITIKFDTQTDTVSLGNFGLLKYIEASQDMIMKLFPSKAIKDKFDESLSKIQVLGQVSVVKYSGTSPLNPTSINDYEEYFKYFNISAYNNLLNFLLDCSVDQFIGATSVIDRQYVANIFIGALPKYYDRHVDSVGIAKIMSLIDIVVEVVTNAGFSLDKSFYGYYVSQMERRNKGEEDEKALRDATKTLIELGITNDGTQTELVDTGNPKDDFKNFIKSTVGTGYTEENAKYLLQKYDEMFSYDYFNGLFDEADMLDIATAFDYYESYGYVDNFINNIVEGQFHFYDYIIEANPDVFAKRLAYKIVSNGDASVEFTESLLDGVRDNVLLAVVQEIVSNDNIYLDTIVDGLDEYRLNKFYRVDEGSNLYDNLKFVVNRSISDRSGAYQPVGNLYDLLVDYNYVTTEAYYNDAYNRVANNLNVAKTIFNSLLAIADNENGDYKNGFAYRLREEFMRKVFDLWGKFNFKDYLDVIKKYDYGLYEEMSEEHSNLLYKKSIVITDIVSTISYILQREDELSKEDISDYLEVLEAVLSSKNAIYKENMADISFSAIYSYSSAMPKLDAVFELAGGLITQERKKKILSLYIGCYIYLILSVFDSSGRRDLDAISEEPNITNLKYGDVAAKLYTDLLYNKKRTKSLDRLGDVISNGIDTTMVNYNLWKDTWYSLLERFIDFSGSAATVMDRLDSAGLADRAFDILIENAHNVEEKFDNYIRMISNGDEPSGTIMKYFADRLSVLKLAENLIAEGKSVVPFETTNRVKLMRALKFNGVSVDSVSPIRFRKGQSPYQEIVKYIDTIDMKELEKEAPKINKLDLTTEQLDEISYDLFEKKYNNLHGYVSGLVEEVYEYTGDTSPVEEFKKNNPNYTKFEGLFHGTGSIAANMILRYGFKNVSRSSKSGVTVVGKSLGEGVYLSSEMDKSLSYCNDGGYAREMGSYGYMFEVNFYGLKKGEDYQFAKGSYGDDSAANLRKCRMETTVDLRGRVFLADEWAVPAAQDQIEIVRVYRIKMVPKSVMKERKIKR